VVGVREAERQGRDIDRQWTLRLERARYEAQLAERRCKAIDPDHRALLATLTPALGMRAGACAWLACGLVQAGYTVWTWRRGAAGASV
jgi:hypothetical protein